MLTYSIFLSPCLDKLRRQGDKKIEYVSICSPNYLHDSHIRLAMRNDAHAICEQILTYSIFLSPCLRNLSRCLSNLSGSKKKSASGKKPSIIPTA
ncbi:MAG: Gfo/Idh/MocA family oxidoreductase, partial [Bacteroidetes bacterium]|nr:Gfo/Idh/MocA family oxidoreductase [Bacteroidota bacterium]